MNTFQYDDAGTTGNPTPSRKSLDMGSVLSRTFATTMRNPALFLGIVIIAALPGAIIAFAAANGQSYGGSLLGQLLQLILGMAAQGAMTYGIYQVLRNKSTTISDALSRSMVNIVPMLLASILVGFGVALGLCLLFVPGIMLMCLWSVTIPACVVEKLGAIASIRRSAALTRGYRWPIFGLILLLGTAVIVIGVIFSGLVIILTGSAPVAALMTALLSAIPQALNCVMTAIIYYDLRCIKEGISLENLVDVFVD